MLVLKFLGTIESSMRGGLVLLRGGGRINIGIEGKAETE